MFKYSFGHGPCDDETYNAHMAVPNAGIYASRGHCRICDGLPHVAGTSAAYEEDLIGLFEAPPTPISKTREDPDLLGLFAMADTTGAGAQVTEVVESRLQQPERQMAAERGQRRKVTSQEWQQRQQSYRAAVAASVAAAAAARLGARDTE